MMLSYKKTIKRLRNIQLFWGLFQGIGAFCGSFAMIKDPTGATVGLVEMLPNFQKLPFAEILFQDYLLPGIALALIIGLSNTISVILLLRRNYYAVLSGMICGIILMLWIAIQFYIFPFNFMSTLYFVLAVLQTLNGLFYYKLRNL